MQKKNHNLNLGTTILLAILIALIPILAWFQYEWTGIAEKAQAERMQDNLRSTAFQLSWDFGREFMILNEIIYSSPISEKATTQQLKTTVSQAVSFWRANTQIPEIFQSLWLVKEIDGQNEYWTLDNSSTNEWKKIPSDKVSPKIIKLFRKLLSFKMGPPQSLEEPFVIADVLSTKPITAVILQMDEKQLQNKLIPRLVDRYFPSSGGSTSFKVMVKDYKTNQVLFQNMPSIKPFFFFPGDKDRSRTPDVTVPLLEMDRNAKMFLPPPPPHFSSNREKPMVSPAVRMWLRQNNEINLPMNRGKEEEESVWKLEVWHVDGSVNGFNQRIRWMNLTLSFTLLAILTAGLVILYSLYRKTKMTVRSQREFVANVSHELRTPISVLRSAAENMKEGLVTNPDQSLRYGQRMYGEADRLFSLIENVLRYAGLEGSAKAVMNPTDMVVVTLSELVRQHVLSWEDAFSAQKSKIIFINNLKTSEDSEVLGDPKALGALLDNLLSNALRYAVPEAQEKQIEILLESSGTKNTLLLLEVRDYGKGISKKDRKWLFEPFYRPEGSRTGGIGLGLSLVRRITLAHDGKIKLTTRPGYGACFQVTLPRLETKMHTLEK